jgi:hypothetical protein
MQIKIRRFAFFIFILGIILFLGLIFSAWVVPHIVAPVAETIWLFLRVIILTVDQVYYWNLLGITLVIWVIFRLARRKSSIVSEENTVRYEAISHVKNWYEALASSKRDDTARNFARDKLLQLVISHYAAKQLNSNQPEIRQAIEQHRLILPDTVYNFLFPTESQRPIKPSLAAFNNTIPRWLSRSIGRKKLYSTK